MRMKIWISALLAGLAFGMFHGARAADLPRNSVKDVSISTTATPNPFAGFYGGLTLGGQITDFNISDSGNQDILSGIAAEGLVYGGHLGYNFVMGEIVAGPYVELAWSNVSVQLLGEDVLTMDRYTQVGGMIGARTSPTSMISAHIGYEWQDWTLDTTKLFHGGSKTDIDATAWVFGLGFDTMVSSNISLGLVVDYVLFDGAEIQNVKLDDYLEGSDALRAKLRLTYHTSGVLPSLDSVKF